MKKALAMFAALCIAVGAPYSGESSWNEGFVAHAQSNAVSGVVKDSKGEPLIGATVMVKGTQRGVSTDVNGRYSIQAATGNVLQISYVGMKTKTVKVASSKTIDVTLEGTDTELEDLVVVGYGQQKKINLTGAVSSVNVEKTLQGRQIADVGRGLQGTTPGLNVVLPNGEIGSDPTIKIRGQFASFQGSTQPLILMDNVEIPSIQIVNPDDVESISVLKDAAAASIYGSKAAFGVILITTKKGAKTESVNVSYSANFAWQNISKDMEMGGVDALKYRVDAMKRVGATIYGAFWYVDEESLAAAQQWQKDYGGKIGKDDPFVYGRDWYVNQKGQKFSKRIFDPYDYMIREWAPSMTHNLSVNGKAGKTSYNIGLGYLDQAGLIAPAKHDDFRRYNASVRLNTEINKYVTVHAGMTYSMRNKRYAYATNSTTADPWLYLYRWDTTYPMGLDDQGHDLRSPYNEMKNANTANKQNTYLSFNAGLTINLTKDWHVNVDYTYAQEDQVWNKIGTKFTMANTWGSPLLRKNEDGSQMYVDKNTGTPVSSGDANAIPAYELQYFQYTSNGSNPDHIRREVTNAKRQTWNITTDYNWQINDANNLKVLLGANIVEWESDNSWSQITNLTDIANPSWDKTGGTQTASGNLYWEGQVGFFGRLNYSLLDKYLLEANLRYDATSKFPEHLRWRWFPSFSAGWRVSEETFMDWAKPALQAAKIRASWGKIGDQSVPSNLYIPTMAQGQMSWIAGGKKLVYVGTPAAVLPDITWQDIVTTDFGVDLSFLDGRVALTYDWYQRDTKNMIVGMEGVPGSFGSSAPKGNFGNLRTRGWELALNLNHRLSCGLGMNATFTISDAKTTITEYGSGQSVDGWYNGKTYGEIWGYEVDRLYQKDDFVYDGNGNLVTTWAYRGKEVPEGTKGAKKVNKLKDPNAVYQDNFQGGNFMFGPGDVKYKDLDGNGDIYNTAYLKEFNGKLIGPNDPNYDNPEAKLVGSNTVRDHGDKKVIGNTTPRYEYGIRLGLDYKGFDFSIFGQGIGKRTVWGSGFLAIPGYNCGDGAMPQAIVGNYWTEDNPNAFYPAAFNMGGSDTGYNLQVSDRYALNMSYFRIKNITLGYTLPVALTRKAYISKCRFYVACENVATFDKLHGLPIDPEVISGVSMWNSGGYNMGRTGIGTPAMKNYSVGIQLNF